MSRLVFGPATDRTVEGDVQIQLGTITRVDGVEQVPITVPIYPDTSPSKLLSVTVCYAPGAPADGIAPADFMAACQPNIYRGDVAGQFAGYAFTATVPNIPAGSVNFVQTILEFDV